MKLIIFTGTYNGRYASAEETIALPIEVNEDIIFGKFEEGVTHDVVGFGELEGKHSECYGDLLVEYVDTEEMSIVELEELLSKLSPLNHLQNFLEHSSVKWWEDYVSVADNRDEIDKKAEEFLDGWESNLYSIPGKVLTLLKNKYSIQTQVMKVKESDYEKALSLLKENGIEVL